MGMLGLTFEGVTLFTVLVMWFGQGKDFHLQIDVRFVSISEPPKSKLVLRLINLEISI